MRKAWLLAALACLGSARAAGNYQVTAAFDATFDTEGRVVELRPYEREEHPDVFWEGMKKRFSGLKIAPPQDASGRPATLRTGLYISLDVTPGERGGQLKIIGMDVRPLVTRQYYACYPMDMVWAVGSTYAVDAECLVGVDGRCGEVKVKASPTTPPSVLQWATVTLGEWEFQSPQLNGVPFAVPFRQSFKLTGPDDLPIGVRFRGRGRGCKTPDR